MMTRPYVAGHHVCVPGRRTIRVTPATVGLVSIARGGPPDER